MENYTSDSSDGDNSNKTLDLSYSMCGPELVNETLEELIQGNKKAHEEIEFAMLHHNRLPALPESIFKLANLKCLDVSSTGLTHLPDIFKYCPIASLIAKNNNLTDESFPKNFTPSVRVRELNFSGNKLATLPEQIFEFTNLKYLYLGGNLISHISRNIVKLKNLCILSIGGNRLTEIPVTLGQLQTLQALVLCDNMIESLPSNIANLNQLKSLLLNKNRLRTLPPEIIKLKNLTELSLRDNPLVVRFVSDMTHNPGNLLELAARTIKLHDIQVFSGDVPDTLRQYLNNGHRCVNRQCKGVFFDNRVEHIKFVDFCGKYRIPLLQYLCSSKCAEDKDSGEDLRHQQHMRLKMKKVLLG